MPRNLHSERVRRKARIRSKIFGTATRPRISIFRSNRYTYAQLIDDEKQRTIAAASTKELSRTAKRVDMAIELGKLLAERAKKLGVEAALLDRGSYRYHGRVKAVAEGVRSGGIKF